MIRALLLLTVLGTGPEWTQFLVPITASGVPGAFGSIWRTDITALVRSTTYVDIRPNPCEFAENGGIACLPAPIPTNRPFDGHQLIGSQAIGQFLYVRNEDTHKVTVNARVYDVARIHETAGAEIPFVTASAFTTGVAALIGIPVAPQYRHTLRVYDRDGRDGARVAVHVYANEETAPRSITAHTLSLPARWIRTTSAQLPSNPAVLQLDPAQLLPSLTGISTLRIEIEPLDPNLRLWSFVSITNNDTHHVTTVSQH